MADNEIYRQQIVIEVTGDEEAKVRVRAMDKYLSQTKKRADALGRAKINPIARLVDQVSKPLATINSGLSKLGTVKTITLRAVDKVTGLVKRVTRLLTSPLMLLGAGTGAAAAVTFPMKLAGEFEQARMSFDFFMGSAKKGEEAFRDLVRFAAETPFEFPFLQDMIIQLMGAGYNFEQAKRALTAFGDAAGRTGAGMEGISNAMIGFTQIAATGTLTMQDLRQVALNLKVPLSSFAKELGVAETQMGKIGEAGISSRKAMDAIIRTLEKRFSGGLKQLSGSLVGLQSTIKDTATLTVWHFGKGMAEPVKRIFHDIVGLTDDSAGKFERFQGRLEDAGRRVGQRLEALYKQTRAFWGRIAADPEFQKLDLGGKIVFVLDKALDGISAWMSGPGGEKLGEVMTKLGEIAARAWLSALGRSIQTTGKSLASGNLFGAAAGALMLARLGGGALLKGGWSALKGLGTLLKGGQAAAAAGGAAAAGAAGTTVTTGAKTALALSKAGKAAWPLAIAAEAVQVATAKDKQKAAVEGAYGLAGMKAGGMAGAALGSVITPGIGTAIGGLLGGAAGYFGGKPIGADVMDRARNWHRLSFAEKFLATGGYYFPGAIGSMMSSIPQGIEWWKKRLEQWAPERNSFAGLAHRAMGFIGQLTQRIDVKVMIDNKGEPINTEEVADEVATKIAKKLGRVFENTAPAPVR